MLKKLALRNKDIESFVENCYDKYMVINFTSQMFIKASHLRENTIYLIMIPLSFLLRY